MDGGEPARRRQLPHVLGASAAPTTRWAATTTTSVVWATQAGTAATGPDLTAASGTGTFGPGGVTQSVSVAVARDAVGEPVSDPAKNVGASGADVARGFDVAPGFAVIVVGGTTRGRMARRIFGTVTARLVERSRRPVIVISPPSTTT